MRFRAAAAVIGGFVLLAFATVAHADPTRCKAAIVRSSTKFVQSKATALVNCEKDVVLGKLPASTDCRSEARAAAKIAKAAGRLQSTIAKACGGTDGICGTADGDDPPASLGWSGACPNFENGSCTNAINNCNDIASCLLCIDEAAVDQAESLYYDDFTPSASSSDLNRCQREIGRSATAFLRSKSQALATCWVGVNLGRATAPCPVPGDGKAANAIARAEARKQANICHACGGNDETCDGNGDFTPAMIGFPGSCPAVTVPGVGSCAGTITTLQDLVDCVDCVTEFKVDCTDRAAVPWGPGGYPAECNPGAAPTPTRTATPAVTPSRTPTPSVTATLTGGVTVTPTRSVTPTLTASATPTTTQTGGATPTRTVSPTPTVTATSAVTATRTPTPTLTAAVTATRTATAVATVTHTPTPTTTATPAACGNGVIDPGEDCDPAGGAATSCATQSNTSAAFTCNPTTCQCACPTKVTFAGDPNDPVSLLDTGWTGISHRSPIISNGEVTVALSGCTGASRPCGTCAVSGPIANPQAGAGQIDNRRCTNDTSRRCTSNTPCTPRNCLGGTNQGTTCTADSQCPGGTCPASGTCQFFFGSNLPLAAGGVSTCVSNVFNGAITGTANVESGAAVNTALLSSSVFLAASVDAPCAKCVGDTTINDGVLGGTCDSGPRQGLSCDGNGRVPSRPDFGTTSLDCPSPVGSIVATLGINLSNATNTVTRTITTNSPNCSGAAGNKCMCGTCNNGNNQACFANADCPDPAGPIGPICNGKRCLGGNNVGAACTANSECPSSSCAVPGEPTKPAACVDDTTNTILDCADGADGTLGDQEGGCTQGPVDTNCTVASGHGQRGCSTDADCGGGSGSCGSFNRKCFLTGGGTFQPAGLDGTDTLVAVGTADAPMNDVAVPTLASIFCVAPTGSASVNGVAGLPGPGRVTIRGTATGLP